jgi:hypothetical protein
MRKAWWEAAIAGWWQEEILSATDLSGMNSEVLRRQYGKFFIHLSYITPLCNTPGRLLAIRIDSDWLELTNVDKYRLLSIVNSKVQQEH